MKKITVIISLILCTSCFIQKGQWIDGQCRPKRPNFKLSKIPLKKTDKLVFNKVYLADTYIKSAGFGFYPDGRLIYFFSSDFDLTAKEVTGKNWNNAKFIGYWRLEDENIKVEYFLCGNSGVYIDKIGSIKGDTIFFERDCGSSPFKREKCWDKFILSEMSFE